MKKRFLILWILVFLVSFNIMLQAQDRFPKPEFETGYKQPLTTTPLPQADVFAYLDIFVLIGAISLASYFVLKKRSRRSLFYLSIFSLLYFGFYREGCVCSIGAIQNISIALFETSYFLPVTVVLFFAIPLIFTLFFGRAFCAAVCPLGAVQDLIIFKQIKIPEWLTSILGIFPYIFLGFAVLFAATGSAFIICRYDPFISIFRFNADFSMILLTAIFIFLGLFIARPYCRFFCPYGVLLNWMSRLSKYQTKITPDECVQCRLCEEACPIDVIKKPSAGKSPETREKGIRRLAILLILLPVVMIVSGWAIAEMDKVLSRMHPTVMLAERIKMEDAGIVKDTIDESKAFRSAGTPSSELFDEALKIRREFYIGGWILGCFLGLVFIMKLIRLSLRRTRNDYEIDRAACVSCGRCFEFCPKEHVRLQKTKA